MKKIYLVKKDPSKDSTDNWITMSGYEFARFMETPDGKSRKDNFGQINSCGDGDDILVVECGQAAAAQLRAEKDRHDYLLEQQAASQYTTTSYSSIEDEDEEIPAENFIPDERVNVAETAFLNLQRKCLREYVNLLTKNDRVLIKALILSDHPLTERQYGEMVGLDRNQVHTAKCRLLRGLKKFLEKNAYFASPF